MNKKMGRPQEKEPSSKLTLYLENDIIEVIGELAKQRKISRSKLVEQLVAEHGADMGQTERSVLIHDRAARRPVSSVAPADISSRLERAEPSPERKGKAKNPASK